MSAVIAPPSLPSASTASVSLWRFGVDQYHAMIDAGILQSGDPVELLEGMIVQKMTRKPAHRIASVHLRDAFARCVATGWHVETQEAISLEDSEPEPDLAIVKGTVDDYPDRHPGAADVGVVVEVSESSLPVDRGLKKRIYARAGIAEYWIVNLIDRQIEVYTQPTGPAAQPDFGHRFVYVAGQSVPVRLASVAVGSIGVSEVLPG